MKLLSRLFAVAVAIALLSACGTAKVAVRPEAAARIHTVAVITVAEPEAYVAQHLGNPGLMFGGVGGIVAGSSSKFMYGYHNPLMSGPDVDAPEACRFKDKNVLFADTAKPVDGMRHSVTAVGDHVVAALRK